MKSLPLLRSMVTVMLCVGLMLAPMHPTCAAAAAASASDARIPEGWPKEYPTADGGTLVLYQPQAVDWKDYKQLEARMALAYSRSKEAKPDLGAVRLKARTDVSLEEALVRVSKIEILEGRFPALSAERSQALIQGISKNLEGKYAITSIDRLMANMERHESRLKGVEVNNDPPRIVYSPTPALLVVLDGEPLLAPISDNELKFVINTNWDLFQDARGTWYLRYENAWLKSQQLEIWSPAGKLPKAFQQLPADDPNWKEVQASLPGRKLDTKSVPAVYVSRTPTELIVTDGTPKFEPVKGTSLWWVKNTDSDLFFHNGEKNYYYLVAGRWFRAGGLSGPWSFATDSLPPDFAKIPADHPNAAVRASIPGTSENFEAVTLANIPQTAKVQKGKVEAPQVTYQGEPKFEPIPNTQLSHAANSSNEVFKVGDLYYMCFQGIWFRSTSPDGPWEVADSVPPQIYEIPASHPTHHVTYVYVVEDDDDEWVTFAYTAGYMGMYVAYGTVVWGSGWYYPPYVWWGPSYPIYYPYPVTYGCGAWYNPWTGRYGTGGAIYGPYGGAGFASTYNPRTGTYARGAVAYGPYGYRGVAEAYNPRTGAYARTRQGGSIYGNWGTSYVQRGDDWVRTAHARGQEGGFAGYRGSEGGGFVARKDDNIYAGHDGNVYRRTGSGWQQFENGEWTSTSRPERQPEARPAAQSAQRPGAGSFDPSTFSQLNRDYQARASGAQRWQQRSNWQSTGASRMGGVSRSGIRRH